MFFCVSWLGTGHGHAGKNSHQNNITYFINLITLLIMPIHPDLPVEGLAKQVGGHHDAPEGVHHRERGQHNQKKPAGLAQFEKVVFPLFRDELAGAAFCLLLQPFGSCS